MSQLLDITARSQSIDSDWYFAFGLYNAMSALAGNKGESVNLPHDYMLAQNSVEDAPAGPAMGYFDGKVAHYSKYLTIPAEWSDEQVLLHFDGIMMNASVEINGSLVTLHHYGYTPFDADITPYIYWGEENRITVTVNPSMQPNSRWYTGSGIYRHVTLVHKPLLHIATAGIFTYAKDIDSDSADLISEVTVENGTLKDHIVDVEVTLAPETFEGESITRHTSLFVKKQGASTARIPMTASNPVLWDIDHPELYTVSAKITDLGTFGAALNPAAVSTETMTPEDTDQVLFGIRSLKATAAKGLLINGNSVKLKGGCIHHDNGILGAVSLYDSEYRKLKKMKDLGYNAVRLAHNPPSADLLDACDRLGMYVFDEAFDAWGMAKQPGDYSQFFRDNWKDDMTSFMLRDRNHPSVILWSTGNEIVERGGLGNGYQLAMELADHMRSIDGTRLITNGLCSYWSGLDDKATAAFTAQFQSMMEGKDDVILQNASSDTIDTSWEERSEAFVNNLDVVGYNYMEDHYEIADSMYPERIILGTESYPMAMEKVWRLVEKLPYVIGDFTWTSYDYIGEAGIGKSVYAAEGDPILKQGPFALMSHSSQYPWRLGNDADFDINGNLLPQGAMRKLLWGGTDTFVFTVNPEYFGKTEVISPWGWPDLEANWSWENAVGKMIHVVVYSAAETVELQLNGKVIGTVPAGIDHHFTAEFDLSYEKGSLEAIGYTGGNEISRDRLTTTGAPASMRLIPETDTLAADGDSLCYVGIEILDTHGLVIPNAELLCHASVEGAGTLAGFGSGNPRTAENYTTGCFTSYRGKLTAVIRAGLECGTAKLTVENDVLGSQTVEIQVQ